MGAEQIRVRPASAADVEAMGRLFEDAFDEPYGAAAVGDLLKPPAAWGLIAEAHIDGAASDEAVPMGFLLAASAADEAEILSIGTPKAFRRRGVADSLINFLVQHARKKGAEKIFLEVAADNEAAIALYAAKGFARVGLRRNYYKRRGGVFTDALVLRRDLD